MPRFFFDIYDGGVTLDDVGLVLPDLTAVRSTAMASLPKIAADEIPSDGDKQHYVIVAKNESGTVVYTATLSYVGLRLA